MNNSSLLKVYSSVSGLTNQFSDYSNVILLPLICLIGMITNSMIILVAISPSSRRILFFKYILATALTDFVFLLSQSPLFIIRCGALCPFGYTFAAKIYEVYVYWFVSYTIVSFQILLNISISIDRLLIFFQVKLHPHLTHWWSLNKFYTRCSLFLIISIVLNVPAYFFSMQIEPMGVLLRKNSTSIEILYTKSLKEEFKSQFWALFLTILSVLKEPLLIAILCVVNIWVLIVFKHHMSQRSKMTSKKKKLKH